MNSNLARALGALCWTALFALSAPSGAQAEIQGQQVGFMWQGVAGLGVTVTKAPSTPIAYDPDALGVVVARSQTGGDGKVSLSPLPPGDYVLVIDGPSLVAAMDKLAPPEKKSGGGFSLGIGGGMFGGGSSHSSSGHPGAGPVGGGSAPSHTSSSSGGGLGLGLSIPIGGNDTARETKSNPPPDIRVTVDLGALGTLSSTSCYCGGTGGARLSFTIPDRTGAAGMAAKPVDVIVSIADQASAGNLTSY